MHYAGKSSIQAAQVQQPEKQQVVQEASELRAKLLQRVAALKLPPNFLDQLIDALGGPKKVAEMTGRRGRVVRDSRGHGTFHLRAKPDSSEMDSLNVKEAGALLGALFLSSHCHLSDEKCFYPETNGELIPSNRPHATVTSRMVLCNTD